MCKVKIKVCVSTWKSHVESYHQHALVLTAFKPNLCNISCTGESIFVFIKPFLSPQLYSACLSRFTIPRNLPKQNSRAEKWTRFRKCTDAIYWLNLVIIFSPRYITCFKQRPTSPNTLRSLLVPGPQPQAASAWTSQLPDGTAGHQQSVPDTWRHLRVHAQGRWLSLSRVLQLLFVLFHTIHFCCNRCFDPEIRTLSCRWW